MSLPQEVLWSEGCKGSRGYREDTAPGSATHSKPKSIRESGELRALGSDSRALHSHPGGPQLCDLGQIPSALWASSPHGTCMRQLVGSCLVNCPALGRVIVSCQNRG